ncbi:MAG: FAD-binding oxidoreductase [Gemmatimonadetes bacterium]|nr:FAD-binding oxidoreductase [Gemmatimonadota bacterium]NNM06522.1 FAD-binding oxidoreductase [Gemmatimonadota bacterium]
MPMTGYDVLIVGGGVVGSSIAYFLSANGDSRALRIAVVEQDSTYAHSSTALSVGGIRQQFSTRENIALSLFSAEFFREAPRTLAVGSEEPDLGFQEAGYLFLASSQGLPVLERNLEKQRRLGADVRLLLPGELGARFPWLNVSDLSAGSLGASKEGWLDPHSLLQGFRKKARSQEVVYLEDRVIGFSMAGGRVTEANLAEAGRVPVGQVVNAAGPMAAGLARLAGITDLPVRPRKRFVYRIQTSASLPGCPMVIDTSGVYLRPEGDGFLCGVAPPTTADPDTLDLDMEYGLFHETVWPALAHRVPALDSLRLGPSWAGHYALNPLDRNAILGPHSDIQNFLFANGFSGHGLQQSPGIGRALSELILHGEYRTLDLGRFSFHRFAEGALVLEENVV